jgi:tRNA modification GTPase
MDELLATANEGQILRRGIRAAIVGRPNAGKSSLLNQLLGHDRAIVSPIAGTTRDTIEETTNIRGIPVVFIDTAGLREARNEIETEGIRRSRESLARAEFILHVLDASEPMTAEDEQLLAEFAQKKRILVRNKTDLPPRLSANELERRSPTRREPAGASLSVSQSATTDSACEVTPPTATPQHAGPENGAPIIDVSCTTGQGLETLKDAIQDLVWSGQVHARTAQVTINSRHQDALRRARESTHLALDALRADASLEFVALDLHLAVKAVGEIVGKTTTEDLLDSIFSQFCVGK